MKPFFVQGTEDAEGSVVFSPRNTCLWTQLGHKSDQRAPIWGKDQKKMEHVSSEQKHNALMCTVIKSSCIMFSVSLHCASQKSELAGIGRTALTALLIKLFVSQTALRKIYLLCYSRIFFAISFLVPIEYTTINT